MTGPVRNTAAALLLLATLSACSNPTEPDQPIDRGVTGDWRGEMVDYRDSSMKRSVLLTLQQNGTAITGQAASSMLAVPGGGSATVEGASDSDGTVTLTIRSVHLGGCFDIQVTLVEAGQALAGDYLVTDVRGGCGRKVLGRRPAFEVRPS